MTEITTEQAKSLTKVSETEFTRQVIKLARLRGWRTAHFRPAKTKHGWRTAVQGDGKGFPDLILIREDRLMTAELKVGKNQPSIEQEEWLKAFGRAGATSMVWTPADWEFIERMLK